MNAIHALRRRPGFAAVAILTISIGIAANTAIFSVIKSVLLEPLPFEDANELVTLEQKDPDTGFNISLSIPNYRDFAERNRAFSHYGAAAGWGWVLTGRGPADVVGGQTILGEFFEVLRVEPYVGRLIPAGETARGAEPTVVLSYGFWQQQFGGQEAALGQVLTLDGQPYTIVGVLPPGWGWPSPNQDLYMPMGAVPDLPWDDRESGFGTRSIARLLPGTTVEMARSDMARVGRDMAEMEVEGTVIPEVRTFTQYFVGDVRAQLWALVAGVAFVLLIAVANVANLQLARGESRRHEVAVRTALGASRWGLVRQLLAESMVLSAIGGTFGVVLAFAGVRVLLPLLPSGVPLALTARIGIDGGVLAFAGGLIVVSGILFGLVPALKASAADPVHEMKAEGRVTRSSDKLRSTLVVAEVALAMVLLVGAGLMVRTFGALQSVDKGFDAGSLLTARLALPDGYQDQGRWIGFHDRAVSELQALPGVRSAAVTLLVPLSGRSWEMRAVPEGMPLEKAEDHSFLFGIVSEDYFQTLGVPIVEGRAFAAADRAGATPVAVIDETMAQRFWPGESALGKRVFLGDVAPESTSENSVPIYRTVIGIAKNVRHYELREPSRTQAYVPYRQAGRHAGVGLTLLVKATNDAEALSSVVRRQVAALDPDIPIRTVRTMDAYVASELSGSRAMGQLFGLFGFLAMILAATGVFGVMSYTVAQRTREIGIRIALGATGGRVFAMVLGHGVLLSALGIAIGFVVAPLLSRLVQSLLFGVAPFDPVTYAALAVSLLGVAMLAAGLPARRAMWVDPVRVLKYG